MTRSNAVPHLAHVLTVMLAAFALAACGRTPAATEPPPQLLTPAPTAVPWSLDVPSAVYSKQVAVGGTIVVTVKVKNSGQGPNPATLINFSDLDKYADLFDCKPECTTEDLPGLGPSAIFPAVPVGKTSSFVVNFVAGKVGAVKWSLCVYDDEQYGQQVWCGDATTAIR